MKKILSNGKVIVSFISVFAILAVSLLSMFTGVSFMAAAEGDTDTGVVTYPIGGKYEADYKEVKTPGIEYVAVDPAKKTKTDLFTGFETDFCVNPNTEGNGTAGNPYIIKTANQFAAVVTCQLKDASDNWIDTDGLYFKIADDIKGFNLKNTNCDVDFSKDTLTAKDVENALKNLEVPSDLKWENKSGKPFKGRFDGNGAQVYGLKGDAGYTAIFPKIGGNITVKNLTIKNCYFIGNNVSALFGANMNPGKSSTFNTRHNLYNCQVYNNVIVCTFATDEAIQKAGVLIGQSEWPTESNLVLNDCLVYGNVAKHAENDDNNPDNRNITYGMVGNLHRNLSFMVYNSILMDSAPHALYHGSNAHLTAVSNNMYTNMMYTAPTPWENVDYNKNGGMWKYVYTYTVSGGVVNVKFDRFNKDGVSDVDYGKGYNRTLANTQIFVVNKKDITGTKVLEGLSSERWTYNKNGYPTPKIYKVREYSEGTNWSGEKAVQFGEGEGTTSAPYTIATAEELALMLIEPVAGACYKLIADIEINDTSVENWTKTAKKWFTSNDVPAFEASLDGDGHTVSGIYYDGKQSGEYAGLIPVIGNTAEIRNIKIANSYIAAKKGYAGALAGAVADKCGKALKFDACTIEDTVEFAGKAKFGGMVGKLGYSMIHINDCISKTNGLFNTVTGIAKVKRSVSVGANIASGEFNADDIKAENVYTDTESTIAGVTVVPADAMKGAGAADAMPGLNFPTSWKVTDDSYPTPTGVAASAEGIVGEAWSGSIATSYALAYENPNKSGEKWVGDGSKEYPYIIETAEQLAYFVWKGEKGTKDKIVNVKLAADIYLSDVECKLWEDKVGGTNWFTQRTTQSYNNMMGIDFDGDGYVIHGLFIDYSLSKGDYIRAGLFPMLGAYSTVRNVGLSNAYMVGRTNDATYRDVVGGFVGCTEDFDKFLNLNSHDAEANKIKLQDPANDYENMAVKFKNCFIDHRSYISAYCTGGFTGEPYAAPIIENCIFTGTIGGHQDPYYTGVLTGCDSTNGSQIRNTVVFPVGGQTKLIGGSGGSSWRSSPIYYVTHATNVYYFATTQSYGGTFKKLSNPNQRVGEEAMIAMPLLDWDETWRTVDGGTPLLRIFDKNRSEEQVNDENNKRVKVTAEYFSLVDYTPPSTTLSFETMAPAADVEAPPAVEAPMYSDLKPLPVLSRDGYEFLGWFVFDDPAIPYEYSYHPPRDLTLYAGWKQLGVVQTFDEYPNTIWDFDSNFWTLNQPGAKGGYKNEYVRNGSKSMHLLGETSSSVDCLLNYEQMLTPGKSYTLSFWVNTDKDDNPATLLSLVHNSKPDYLNSTVAIENIAVVKGLKVGKWVQYTYSFTAQTKWVSLRATGAASLWFDDVIMAELDAPLATSNIAAKSAITGVNGGTLAPKASNTVSVAVLISVVMTCAVVAVLSRKDRNEVVED